MTQTKHTPGPWLSRHDDYARGRIHIGPKTDDTVCTLSGRQSTRNAADANARLIAATGELLEAAEKLEQLLGPIAKVFWAEFAGTENLQALDALRAAIAKARGES